MDALDAAGLPHQAYSPDFALELTQSSSDFDMIFIQESLPCWNILNPVGEGDGGHFIVVTREEMLTRSSKLLTYDELIDTFPIMNFIS